ncbi:putative alpha-galactosidase B [Leucoagaricus sp. SymC.cos]|nr:putative alpha-galactosidase B [Leucoagaricus sp. SymC.cos]
MGWPGFRFSGTTVSLFAFAVYAYHWLTEISGGTSAWNAFQCNIDEDLILETAYLMQSLGLQDAGYSYVNIDDCYAEKNRSQGGDIIEDRVRFKNGMKKLNEGVHALGFKTGIYGDSGWFTCGGYPGSWGNELHDLRTFANWGFDYLKYDNCAIPYDSITRTGIVGKYQRMADAVKQVAKETRKPPIVFSLCEWGWSQVWLWGAELGQSWRTTGDIAPKWESLTFIINFNSFITQATDFYGRNDLDMVTDEYFLSGNGGLTYEEAKSHFTAWALMKSPLLVGCTLPSAASYHLSCYLNCQDRHQQILGINQDSVVGKSISPFRWGINPDWTSNSTHPAQYWSGPCKDGIVFMLLNTLDEPATMTFNLTESPWIRAGRQYTVRDLWMHTDNGTAIRNFTAHDVPPHGVVALLLKDADDEPEGLFPECSVWWQCTDRNGTRVGG